MILRSVSILVLSLAIGKPSLAQSTDPFRQAYPLCFDLFPAESSEEQKACIEVSARNPSNWSRETLADSVRQELERQRKAEVAARQLEANREAANQQLTAQPGDPNALEFKGIALGIDRSTIEATGRFACRPANSPIADHLCHLNRNERETIAGAPVKILLLYFYSDKLQTISISFDPDQFASVAEALIHKYGTAATTTEVLQNRMGATFENKKLVWRKGKAELEARRYAGKLDRSSVTYRTDFSVEEFARRRNSSAKSKAKDL